jgi:hypothetical protein
MFFTRALISGAVQVEASFDRCVVSSLPTWGVHNQTVILLLAAQASNSWARQLWCDETERQRNTAGRLNSHDREALSGPWHSPHLRGTSTRG